MRSSSLFLLGVAGTVLAHGDHAAVGQKPIVDDSANWMTKHMAEEHHVTDFDAASFFTLHDYNADGHWDAEELLRTYGLFDESNEHVSQERRDQIVKQLMDLLDASDDGFVSREEFQHFIDLDRKVLPDLGTGPGHHGDDEYEYEIHHWEKFHDENTKLEDLTHPEDIEHFKKHEAMEREQDRIDKLDQQAIVEENIPEKFRRL